MSTIFSKIIAGEIPSYKIYEDEHVFAFLDINPMQKGHTLVVPKVEVDNLFDLDEEMYSSLMLRSKDIAKRMKDTLGCARVCVVVEGYAIPHAHVHLIPTNQADDFDKKNVYRASAEELKEMQAILIS
ncbi:MAG: HIT family protein [Candidatus Paceibacterota bacterium]